MLLTCDIYSQFGAQIKRRFVPACKPKAFPTIMGPGQLEEQFDHAVHQLVRLASHLNLFVNDRIHGRASRPVTHDHISHKVSSIHFSSKLQCYTSSEAQCAPRVIHMRSPFASLSSALGGAGSLGGSTGKASDATQGRSSRPFSKQPSSGTAPGEGTEEDESQERILISEVRDSWTMFGCCRCQSMRSWDLRHACTKLAVQHFCLQAPVQQSS